MCIKFIQYVEPLLTTVIHQSIPLTLSIPMTHIVYIYYILNPPTIFSSPVAPLVTNICISFFIVYNDMLVAKRLSAMLSKQSVLYKSNGLAT